MSARPTPLAFLALFFCASAAANGTDPPENVQWPVILTADVAANAQARDGYRTEMAALVPHGYGRKPPSASQRSPTNVPRQTSESAESREVAPGFLLLWTLGLLALVLTRRRARYPMQP
jgi:hypothetical protein